MERTIDVTIYLSEENDVASVAFLENESGDRHATRVDRLDNETAQEIGWEILSWIELMRDDLAWRRENEKEA